MQNQTFRLFVSSPFSDFKKERDVLHKKVFPKIDKYCNENGFSFQPVDLRWGVSSEAQLDQKTLEVCLEEVRACKHFPHPNFLIMAGDRYGYIPLPYMIEKAEFDKIKEIYENDKEKISINYKAIKNKNDEILSQKIPKSLTKVELLDEWYKLDENQIPISYILKPRKDEYKEYPNWQIDQEYLRTILQNAANILFENKENKEYLKYFTSATEAEVLEGILEYKGITQTQEKLLENKIVENSKIDKEYVYGYIRTIQNPIDKYIDSMKDKEKEGFLKQKAIDFKTNLSNTLDKDKNILTSAYDSIELYEENQLKEFEEFIYEKLINAIETQKNISDEISSIDKEILEQEKFKEDKQKGFIGRENTLNKIKDYVLNDKTNEPLVIYGISGMGKSSLIAKAIDNVSKLIPKNSLIYRFVGATQNSTTIRSLLISICDELANKNIIEKIEKYEFEEYKFFKQINKTLSSIEESIVLFIDALDQLQFKDSLEWLPENLPENFKIILSVLNDEKYEKDSHYYNFLKNKVDSNNLIDISKDSLESSKELLIENLLFDLDRKIDDYQTNYLLNKWKETNYSPLYLKIAIEEVKHWKSGDKTQKVESSVEGIVKEYIKNLSKIYHHEEIFVNKVFGYIHVSKDGLCEKELLEILSEDLHDNKVMKNLVFNKFHEPIKVINPRRKNNEEHILPMSIWSRLHTQIKPFIIERNIDNKPLMKFFHRQFTSVVDDLTKESKIQLHKKLSSYFYTLQNKNETWDKRYHNLHMLAEYPYQVYKTKKYPRILKSILFDLEFAGSIYNNNKQDSFRDIMSKATQLDNITEDKLYPWESFYREKEHLILKVDEDLWRPHQTLFQLAYEDGDDSPLTKEAEKLLQSEKIEFEWLRLVNRPKNVNRTGLLKVLEGHKDLVGGVKILEDGRILSYSYDNTLRLWDMDGKTLKVLEGHTKTINGIEILEDGRILSYADDKTLRLWDRDGNILKILEGHSGKINSLKILEDGRILSYSYETLRLWDKDGKLLNVLEGHTKPINGMEILEDGRILSYSDDKTLRLWDKDGNLLKVLEGHTDKIRGVKILKDKIILSYSDDTTLRLWNSEGEFLKVLEGHTQLIIGIELLKDGNILSYSADETLILWNTDGILLKVVDWVNGFVSNDEIFRRSFKEDNELKKSKKMGVFFGLKVLSSGHIIYHSYDNNLRIWNIEKNELKILKGHNDLIKGIIVLSNDTILSYSYDNTLKLWNKEYNELSTFLLNIGSIRKLEVLTNGNIISYSNDNILRIWNIEYYKSKFLNGHRDSIVKLEILENSEIISSSNSSMILWDKHGNKLKNLEWDSDLMLTLESLKVKRKKRFSLSRDKIVKIWFETNDRLSFKDKFTSFNILKHAIKKVQILEDGKIVSHLHVNIRLLNEVGEELRVLSGHTEKIKGVEILKGGNILSYSSDSIIIWNKENYKPKVLKSHTNNFKYVDILEDGRILSFSGDRILKLLNQNGDILKNLYITIDDNIKGCCIITNKNIIFISNNKFFIYEIFYKPSNNK